MSSLASHLIVAPVVLPLVAAAVLLVMGETRRRFKAHVNIAATLAGLVVAVTILLRVDGSGGVGVYLASNWEAPFGIVLVADRLSALLLVLAGACLALSLEWALLGLPLLWLALDRFVVPHEEARLAQAFPAAWSAYAGATRRWL